MANARVSGETLTHEGERWSTTRRCGEAAATIERRLLGRGSGGAVSTCRGRMGIRQGAHDVPRGSNHARRRRRRSKRARDRENHNAERAKSGMLAVESTRLYCFCFWYELVYHVAFPFQAVGICPLKKGARRKRKCPYVRIDKKGTQCRGRRRGKTSDYFARLV